jgi:pantoate--beta-alanine ligase
MGRMILVRTVADLRRELTRTPRPHALVPTMGFLHEGHLSLMRMARAEDGTVVASLFVNPTQFNDPRDLEAYPRDENRDEALSREAGCDLLFAPPASEVYRDAPGRTVVHVAGVSERWEGEHRPGHFDGVATIVAKLLNMVDPDVAYFGEKDWQQCRVVKQMVTDLDFDVRIEIGPTIREPDGLAMSSRNARLSDGARSKAPALFRELRAAAEAFLSGVDPDRISESATLSLLSEGFDGVDYFAVVDADTMSPAAALASNCRVIAAATIDNIRLIDNIAV